MGKGQQFLEGKEIYTGSHIPFLYHFIVSEMRGMDDSGYVMVVHKSLSWFGAAEGKEKIIILIIER